MGIKAPKDQSKTQKKQPLATKVGAAMNKKMQAKFAQSQKSILKSLAKETIEEVRESPDSKNMAGS